MTVCVWRSCLCFISSLAALRLMAISTYHFIHNILTTFTAIKVNCSCLISSALCLALEFEDIYWF